VSKSVSKSLISIGLMSGTSLDGIDVAMLTTDGINAVERGPSHTFRYTPEQRTLLRQALAAAVSMPDRQDRTGVLGEAEEALTKWHIDAVQDFLQSNRLNHSKIDVIGFHGQTVLHRPEDRITVQLGDGDRLARATGIKVAYDLRAKDIASGGQGAPLVPAYHRAIAAGITNTPVAFVNIGGVANVTYVGSDSLIAFDTGPGNALIDDWMQSHTGTALDEGGAVALSGRVDEATAAGFLGDHYFDRPGPKSLDRNRFASLSLHGLSPQDGAATLAAITARAIAHSRIHFPHVPTQWIICGGGRKNEAIMRKLRGMLPNVTLAEDVGLNGDSMEAEAWAYLAVRSMRGLPISFPETTGVPHEMTGGVIAAP
jgi:anhydro-N-acetylmuramic acid kinase